jgi:cell division transport system ATP-binding protein
MDQENQSPVVIELIDAEIMQGKVPVLSEVSFRLNKGEFAYLIGKTGMGKSSLLKTLYADIPLKTGEATIAGFSLNGIKKADVPYLRRKLGVIFQDFQLLSDRNVRENLRFVLQATGWTDKNAVTERIDEVLDQVGLRSKDFRMTYELSGGEQQRLGIARALLNQPEIILADEPTGNLDPDTSQEIIKLLFDISSRGTAVLMASHDYLLIEKYPSRLLKIEGGKVVDLGGLLF